MTSKVLGLKAGQKVKFEVCNKHTGFARWDYGREHGDNTECPDCKDNFSWVIGKVSSVTPGSDFEFLVRWNDHRKPTTNHSWWFYKKDLDEGKVVVVGPGDEAAEPEKAEEPAPEPTYKIVRYFAGNAYKPQEMRTGLTLAEAADHCCSDEATGYTCSDAFWAAVHRNLCVWYDGFLPELEVSTNDD